MKPHFNMTEEEDFGGNATFFKENKPYTLTFWDVFWFVLSALFAIGFFGLLMYVDTLHQENAILEAKIVEYANKIKLLKSEIMLGK